MSRVDVTLAVKNARFRTGMAQASQAVEGFEKRWSKIMSFGAGAFTGAAAIAGLNAIAEKYDRIGKLAVRLRQTPEDIQRLGFVAGQTGSDLERVAKALDMADRKLGDIKNNRLAGEGADFLGINPREFLNADVLTKLALLADAFENAGDKSAASAALYQILGRNLSELKPTLDMGGEGIRELGNSISVLAADAVADIEAMNDAWDKFKHNLTTEATSGVMGIIEMLDVAADAAIDLLAGAPLGTTTRDRQLERGHGGRLTSNAERSLDRARSQRGTPGSRENDDFLARAEAMGPLFDAIAKAEEGLRAADAPLADQLAAASAELQSIRDGFAGLGESERTAAQERALELVKVEYELTKKVGEERTKAAEEAAAAAADAAAKEREAMISAEAARRAAALDTARAARDDLLARLDSVQGSIGLGSLARFGGGFGSDKVNLDAEASATKDIAKALVGQNATVARLEKAVVVLAAATGKLDEIAVEIPPATFGA